MVGSVSRLLPRGTGLGWGGGLQPLPCSPAHVGGRERSPAEAVPFAAGLPAMPKGNQAAAPPPALGGLSLFGIQSAARLATAAL